ncbi:hypothetical protein SERLA73DRAFT_65956, partial [Serpula lacrymans var. lacrymans S7.3]
NKTIGNGRDYTVSPEWEDQSGIKNNLFLLKPDTITEEVVKRYSNNKYFSEIVEWLTALLVPKEWG